MRIRRPKPNSVALAVWCLPILALALALVAITRPEQAVAAPAKNSCEACHSNPDFLVQNKQLFDYFQEWTGSVHEQEGVSCVDCHGGNAAAADKAEAHADGVGASDPDSGVYYANIPDVCGSCHAEILAGFRKSHHFEHLRGKERDPQGPSCVTCHGSIDSEVLNVNSVAAACARCHNDERDNHPEHPEKAQAILNRFLSIDRFYRYIGIRAEPDEARAFFERIDPKLRKLAVTWHGFDLEQIEAETAEVFTLLEVKRDEIRARRAEAE